MKSPYKIVIFDFEGVIQDGNIWENIAKHLGIEKEDKELYDSYHKKEFDYETWLKKISEIYIEKGLSEEDFHKIGSKMSLIPGAKEAIKEIKNKGYLTAIISGGIKNNVLWWKKALGIDAIAVSNKFIFKDGKLKDVETINYDYEGKVKALELILKQFKLKPEEVIYIGDNKNDRWIFEKVGFPIAFNTNSEEIKKIAKAIIEKKDLREILQYT